MAIDIFSLPAHPVAELFPMMTDAELDDLASDIKENGLRFPVTLDSTGATLVDGRNRREACRRAGLPIMQWEALGPDADTVKFIVSANLKRRHLNESERGMIAARMARLARGTNRHATKVDGSIDPSTLTIPIVVGGLWSCPDCSEQFSEQVWHCQSCAHHWQMNEDQCRNCHREKPTVSEHAQASPIVAPISRAKAAEHMNVSEGTVKRSMGIVRKGVPELVGAVTAQKISIHRGYDISRLTPDKQRAAVQAAATPHTGCAAVATNKAEQLPFKERPKVMAFCKALWALSFEEKEYIWHYVLPKFSPKLLKNQLEDE